MASTNDPASTPITEEQVRTALSRVTDPDLGRDIVSLGFVKKIAIDDRRVDVVVQLTTPACPVKDQMQAEIESILRGLGFTGVNVEMTAQVVGNAARRPGVMPGVRNTIAVASGKGGVGKSSVAVNLAVALAREGSRVGLLDADIYGPSAPLMFGLVGAYPPVYENEQGDRRLEPLEAHGVKVMSIGFLIDPDQPVIWRGPMAGGALKQFISDVEWGELDYMIFDMPPGTGDIQLTLTQSLPLSGAVIVTTPQNLALEDARKGLKMFQRVNVPVLGIVENMSYFIAPDTGKRYDIFSHGGGEKAAADLGVPFLGEIPLTIAMREGGDTGVPIVVGEPESEQSKAICAIARRIAAQVSVHNLQGEEEGEEEMEIVMGKEG